MVKTRSQQKLELESQPRRTSRRLSEVQKAKHPRITPQESKSEGATKGRANRAPKRRKRAAASSKVPGKVISEQAQKCTDISSMPLEIIFEVASRMPPKDLVALSRTSKAFYRTLYSPNASSIWKAARSAVGAPDCSPGFSEAQWASLLFGRPVCEQCGAKNVHDIDLNIRRRVCIQCMEQNLVHAEQLWELFPGCASSILDMVPYTRSGGRTSHHGSQPPDKFFWASDVERIAFEWATLNQDIHMYVKGARDKADAYRIRRFNEVARIAWHAKVCSNWLRRATQESRKEAHKKLKARFYVIRDRLLTMGYDRRDIHFTEFTTTGFCDYVEFTDELWARIQPGAVILVESARDSRIRTEWSVLRRSRTRALQPFFQEYAKSLAPTQWCYLPSIYELAELPVFKDIVEASANVTVTTSSFAPAAAQLPALIPEWISAKRAKIISMLEPSESPPGAVDLLDLATSVFQCTSNRCFAGRPGKTRPKLTLISWEEIAAHSCHDILDCFAVYNPRSVGVSQLGTSTASSLVRVAGLDPSSATIAQMDTRDLRFTCLECPPPEGDQGKVGLTWKSAVEHSMMTKHVKWHKMTSRAAQRVKQTEQDSSGDLWAWSCNHCADHFNSYRRKDAVIKHLNEKHQITSPAELSDLFWYPGYHHTPAAMTASSGVL